MFLVPQIPKKVYNNGIKPQFLSKSAGMNMTGLNRPRFIMDIVKNKY